MTGEGKLASASKRGCLERSDLLWPGLSAGVARSLQVLLLRKQSGGGGRCPHGRGEGCVGARYAVRL